MLPLQDMVIQSAGPCPKFEYLSYCRYSLYVNVFPPFFKVFPLLVLQLPTRILASPSLRKRILLQESPKWQLLPSLIRLSVPPGKVLRSPLQSSISYTLNSSQWKLSEHLLNKQMSERMLILQVQHHLILCVLYIGGFGASFLPSLLLGISKASSMVFSIPSVEQGWGSQVVQP